MANYIANTHHTLVAVVLFEESAEMQEERKLTMEKEPILGWKISQKGGGSDYDVVRHFPVTLTDLKRLDVEAWGVLNTQTGRVLTRSTSYDDLDSFVKHNENLYEMEKERRKQRNQLEKEREDNVEELLLNRGFIPVTDENGDVMWKMPSKQDKKET